MDAMSKKERLARGSAVIKVMRVIPRPGHYLKSYMDVHKLPKKVKIKGRGAVEMPHLDVKNAFFEFSPQSAKVAEAMYDPNISENLCSAADDKDPTQMGLPEGDRMMGWFGYREWANVVNPASDNNVAEHFNVMLGLLISMAEDPENENFADTEAYPCIQFLKTVKSPDGDIPYNCSALIGYIEYVCQKMLDEG